MMQQNYPAQPQAQEAQPQPVSDASNLSKQLANLANSGAPSILPKHPTPGFTAGGIITKIQSQQATDFRTGQPDFFKNGAPKIQFVITMLTTQTDPSNPADDGTRRLWIKGWGNQRRALLAAVQQGGFNSPEEALKEGNLFEVTYVEDRPVQGFNGQNEKIYAYRISREGKLDNQQAPQGAQQAPQAAPQAPQAAQAPQATPAQPGDGAATTDAYARAKQLKALSLPVDQIAQATGLTIEQINQIQ